MTTQRWAAIGFGAGVHVARFAVILLALGVGPLLGIGGWYLGLFANACCTVFAVALVTARGLWPASGAAVLWRGPRALLLLVPFALEVALWAVPSGLTGRAPGFGLWAMTLVLVGVNEELTSRVVVLERLRTAFPPLAAVALTGALFGLQHLSAFATTGREAADIAGNVVVSACYGFALAAFQYRFHWVTPLILLHAAADFTTILAGHPLPDLVVVATVVGLVAWGVVILWRLDRRFGRRAARKTAPGHRDSVE